MKFLSILKQTWKGHSLTRALMNESFRTKTLKGSVVDIGGGRDPDYFSYFNILPDASIKPIDQKIQNIDFEIDTLPYENDSIDTVVCCNLLEHIYNHMQLVSEMNRILKPEGTLVGFVPFLVQYHPDPHDYFRYTNESLKKIFADSGYSDMEIQPVGLGPVAVSYTLLTSSFPKIIKVLLVVCVYPLAFFTVWLKPALRTRFPLGYTFVVRKP